MRRALARPIRLTVAFFSLAVAAAPWRTFALLLNEVIIEAAGLLSAYALKLVVNAVVHGDIHAMEESVLLLAGAAAAASLFGRNYVRLTIKLGEVIGVHVDARLVALSCGIPTLEHHETPRYMDEMTLLRQGRAALGQVMNAAVLNLRSAVLLVGAIAILASVDPWLALLPVAVVPSALASSRGAARLQAAQEANASRFRLRQHLYRTATTPEASKELRIFGLADELASRHRSVSETMMAESDAAGLTNARLSVLSAFLFTAGYVAAIGLVLIRAVAHQVSLGDVVLVVSLALMLNSGLSMAVVYGHYVQQVVKVVGRYLWLVDYAADHDHRPARPASLPQRLASGLELRHVCFSYPDSERAVLSGISLHLPAGKVVALVGENGSGKSTLVKVLCGLYRPSQGELLVDGIPLGSVDAEEWRLQTSAAFQDYVGFELLMGESVGIGHLEQLSAKAAVAAALTRAGGAELVTLGAEGLDTQLGRQWGGIELSGGQWQKVALARALMRDQPLVVVFDEPTAALDAATERTLFERFASEARSGAADGRVTLLVSHRFSTVQMADLIIVLSAGQVIEVGSHKQLLVKRGTYAELFELQARAYRA